MAAAGLMCPFLLPCLWHSGEPTDWLLTVFGHVQLVCWLIKPRNIAAATRNGSNYKRQDVLGIVIRSFASLPEVGESGCFWWPCWFRTPDPRLQSCCFCGCWCWSDVDAHVLKSLLTGTTRHYLTPPTNRGGPLPKRQRLGRDKYGQWAILRRGPRLRLIVMSSA